MRELKKHARLLYILALLQLVGGPLVIVQTFLVGKVATQAVVEHGWSDGAALVLASPEFDALCQAIEIVVKPGEPQPMDRKAPEGKAAFGKSPWLPWENSLQRGFFVSSEECQVKLPPWQNRWLGTWCHAPPGPPPRCLC
jgi:hypothetical protein